ncbi:hypothetical protein KR222_005936, partial [Zaprionus bogoriensis]
QFLAARTIQKRWREHHELRQQDIREKAAITIQRWWRGFHTRRTLKASIEERLQQAVVGSYNAAATKIQALFRGWRVRQTVHNMASLHIMQSSAAEELLSCVAYKLHHLLRTYSIPGIYSILNSHCLSRVEKLLDSIKYRFYNDRVRYYRQRNLLHCAQRREHFKKNKHYTVVPYGGPDFNDACPMHGDGNVFFSKQLDERMYKIISSYENSRGDTHLKNVQISKAKRDKQKYLTNIESRQSNSKRDFCGDVIDSMRRWKIWDDKRLEINKDIFRTPDNLEKFLLEASSIF